jgi:hypothetical protein
MRLHTCQYKKGRIAIRQLQKGFSVSLDINLVFQRLRDPGCHKSLIIRKISDNFINKCE